MRKGSKKLIEDILNQKLFFMLPLEISQSLPRHEASLFSSLSPVPSGPRRVLVRAEPGAQLPGLQELRILSSPNTLVKSSRAVGRGTHYPAVRVQAPGTACGSLLVGACSPSRAAVPW